MLTPDMRAVIEAAQAPLLSPAYWRGSDETALQHHRPDRLPNGAESHYRL